jgi:phage FluMu protein Com
MIIKCPSCQNEFEIAEEEPEILRRLTCPHCQMVFEVTWLYPLTLDFLEEDPVTLNRSIESLVN